MPSPRSTRHPPLRGCLLLAAALATALLQSGCATADAGTTASPPQGSTGTATAKKPGSADPSRPAY
jgi:hypothetical protein